MKTNHFAGEPVTVPSEEVKQKLIADFMDVMRRMRAYGPVKFVDQDCDGGMYNFHDIMFDEKGVAINLTMWEDIHNLGSLEK